MEKKTHQNDTQVSGNADTDIKTPLGGTPEKVLNNVDNFEKNVDKSVEKSETPQKPETPKQNKDFVIEGDFDDGMLPVLTEEEMKHSLNWKINHIKIVKKFVEMLDKDSMIPDAISIANELKLTPTTVSQHLRKMCFTNYKNTIKPLTYPAIIRLAKTAKEDNPQNVTATKLLFQIAEDWSEKNTQIIVEVNQIIEIANQMIAAMKTVIDSTDFKVKDF